jgi:hypothetical protein
MALIPTGSNIPTETRAELIRRINRPNTNKTPKSQSQELVTSEKKVQLQNIDPQPGFRIRTATTNDEIESQIRRLSVLIANDNIDQGAPRGSYINMLL